MVGYRKVTTSLAATALLLAGCGKDVNELVLARIGEATITVADFDASAAKVPIPRGRPTRDDPERIASFLETMVAKELLVLEARARGYFEDERLLAGLETRRRRNLFDDLDKKEIEAKVTIDEQELRDIYANEKFDIEWRVSLIACATEDSARMAVERARAGEDFAELAKLFSIDPKAEEKGPDIGFYRRVPVRSAIVSAVVDLNIGEVADPIAGRRGSRLVLKVTDIRGVTFDDARPTLESVLRPRKERERGQEIRKLLLGRVSASVDTSVIDTIWNSLVYATEDRPMFTPEEDSLIVVRWEGTPQSVQEGAQVAPGSANLRRFINFMVSAGAREVMEDSTALWRQVEDMILIEHLIPSYFAELGYDQAPEFIAKLDGYHHELAVTKLKREEVDTYIEETEEALKGFWEGNPDQFMDPEHVIVLEVLSKTKEESLALRDSVFMGVDMQMLAARHTTRDAAKHSSGVLGPFKRGRFGRLGQMAFTVDPDSLVGPVLTDEGYSLFKVTEKTPATVQPYQRARPRARQKYRKSEETRLFKALVDRLREKYAGQIEVEPYVENQSHVLAEAEGEAAVEAAGGAVEGS
jgi:parvulin-like peptidyl-prolyl isomerase